MLILGIETSCDETAASVIKATKKTEKVEVISNIISSSLSLHSKTGGIIPEIAAREQIKYIIPVIEKAISMFKKPENQIDAIAVTVGPGLIGSLLVGIETARVFSYIWKKPLIGVNHLIGHIYANWIKSENDEKIEFPIISLVVSGGHTDLVLIKDHEDWVWLGGTRDDAAGEAFDKTGRILGLEYPAGRKIEELARKVRIDSYKFPRPLIDSSDFDFSFSGLKTAVLRESQKIEKLDDKKTSEICFSLQEAIFDILLKKTFNAVLKYDAKTILLGGGVAANEMLKRKFKERIKNLKLNTKLFVPEKILCTDNAAMIASASFYNYQEIGWNKISANPELYFD